MAIAHLAADGATYFLVVRSGSVIVNCTREIGKHTDLRAYRLYGPDQARNRGRCRVADRLPGRLFVS